jgi:NAD(P)-dependent dehydrogenase (short-subunit alcohol dehydrogenase family)
MESTITFFKTENNFFKNKNIIITGATSPVGISLVETLCSLGANLLLISHNESKLKNTFSHLLENNNKDSDENEIRSQSNNNSNNINIDIKNEIQYEIIDLENPKEINSKYPLCLKKLKAKLDILLICHGISCYTKIKDCSKENFDKIMNINVRSVFHILSISVPFLKLTKGNCVILSSIESFIPKNTGFLNTTSKAMINSLVQNSALELSYFNVRINAVAPAMIKKEEKPNEMNNYDFSNIGKMGWGGLGSGGEDEYLEMFPLGKKLVEKENVVDTILFLASDEASFITGEIIQNDNGYGINHDMSYTK